MKILGIESSCDETAASVVEDGRRLLSNVVHTQIDIHKQYGGVVPEVAARSHIEYINPVINQALTESGCTWDDIDAIAVTYAPGLIGSLLVGTLAARTLAIVHGKPLYAVHHVEAHVYANFVIEDATKRVAAGGVALNESGPTVNKHLQPELVKEHTDNSTTKRVTAGGAAPTFDLSKEGADQLAGPASSDLRSEAYDGSGNITLKLPSKQPDFPMLALIVSGGHTQLVLFHDHGDYELLGQTRDDAVGEAFDKVAKIIGLPYPGGPSVAEAAKSGDPHKYKLPKSHLDNPYDFSFSGLKTAVLRAVQAECGKDYTFPSHELPALVGDQMRADFAASFQQTTVETLVDKAERAYRDYSPASVVIAGGVAANAELRRELRERLPINIEYAPMQFCTDNAVMIATLGYYMAQKVSPISPYDFEVIPSLSMTKTAWAK